MHATEVPASGIGARQVRLEDEALITGAERYTADLHVPGALQVIFVRSTAAHARITGLDVSQARLAPGVVAVLTSRDLEVPRVFFPSFGQLIHDAYHRAPLADSTVRFVGTSSRWSSPRRSPRPRTPPNSFLSTTTRSRR